MVERVETSEGFANLVGESPIWAITLKLLRRIATTDETVLVDGETGTGKDLAARAIHYLGERRACPFIPINCGALPDSLLESELFGYERGAFTDARDRRVGLVAAARGGTLFLDEVEAMTPRAQVVLLRFLQDQTYLPLGAREVEKTDVRIVAASNVDLAVEVERGRFRSDLWFRLRVLTVSMPALRDRGDDRRLLAQLFLTRYAEKYRRGPHRLSAQAIAAIAAYRWPGNVRELESVVLREFLLHDEGDGDELCVQLGQPVTAAIAPPKDFKGAKAVALADFERTYLRELLTCTQGNLSLAARLSRKDRSALTKLVKKHGLAMRQFRADS